MNVTQRNVGLTNAAHHSSQIAAKLGLTTSVSNNHSSVGHTGKSLNSRSLSSPSSVRALSNPVQTSGQSNGDRYISAVHDHLAQKDPDLARRFDDEVHSTLSRKTGTVDDTAKIKVVDQVLDSMTKRGEISSDTCAQLKALNPAQGSDAATDNSMTVAHPAAPHVSGNGEASGPELPNPTFLWKPSSDSDGNLVILLPAEMTGQVADVEVLSPDGKTVLAKGKYTGAGNGMREHYRFGKPGASFPPGSIVRINMANGTQREIKIPNTGSRMESK